jgi:hypothetical protein
MYGMRMSTAGWPGHSSKVFHIGKHLSALITVYDRQEYFNLLWQTGETIIHQNTLFRGGDRHVMLNKILLAVPEE